MKKLKLYLEILHVESFESAPVRKGRGTVHGCDDGWTDANPYTCWLTCGQTVRYTACNTNPCM